VKSVVPSQQLSVFPNWLPPTVEQLTETTSIRMAQSIQTKAIATPICPEPIATTYVRQGPVGTPPNLLLHGFDSSVLEFRRLLPRLAERADTWAVDLLGFGFTQRPAGMAFSPQEIKLHLYCFWEEAIAHPVVLVGASMGGAAAIDFALTYPEAVSQLVLLDSAGFAGAPPIGKLMFPPLGYLATEFLRNSNVRDRISRAAYFDAHFASRDATTCAALHLESPGWRRATIAFTKSGGYTFLADKIPQLDVETLIIWGENDRILGTRDATRFQQAIARSKLVWILDCGHVPHLEKPEVTAEHILSINFAEK
jgi:pimeloyl-ACP methyl ester carboxylesterase